jgi:hypothetical protein
MAVKLHRCRNEWVKIRGHPCWRVEKALRQAGVEYEVVPGPVRRSERDELEEHTGQRLYPAIEFDDGSWYKDDSKAMAEQIRSGKLFEPPASGRATE